MPATLLVIIIDHDPLSRAALSAALRPYSGTIVMAGAVEDFSHGMTMIHNLTPDMVFLGVENLQQGVDAVQSMTRQYPRVSVIASSSEKSSQWILALMRAGAAGFLLRPFSNEEVHNALQKLARFLVTHGNHNDSGESGRCTGNGSLEGGAPRSQPRNR